MTDINQFTYKGKRSYDDMCLVIVETPSRIFAERDIEFISVPGRSGDLLYDNLRYKNIEKKYKVALFSDILDFSSITRRVSAWLQATPGYYKLTDTYDPNYFYYACYRGHIDIADILQKIGTSTLKFNCKPFKYSFSGQNTLTFTEPCALFNSEFFPSFPYIKITGRGTVTLTVNNSAFTFTDIDEYIEIDSEIMNAYKGIVSQNNKMRGSGFPILSPGKNNISWVGDVEKLEIIPRWCCL